MIIALLEFHHNISYKVTGMVGLSKWKTIEDVLLVLTEYTNMSGGWTDSQPLNDGIDLAYAKA